MSHAAASKRPSLVRRASRTVEIVFTTLVAWSFGLVCVGVLLYIASGLWRGDYQTATPLSAADPATVSVGGVNAAHPWGLTFTGATGALMAAVQAGVVAVALGLSMAFAAGPRQLGLFVLSAWAGLCAADGALVVANTWNGSGFSASMPVFAGAAALIVVFGCMVHRMMLLWKVKVTVA